ncbi:uncharacterized protein LOC122516969 [Polistes fuscatus]|uniref:uncharacterized protein LOC122516969 n=1 Tax=Polistes fuscatus TaxID=30207 RepID=UPI001CA92976|nr:uncharacterized protein LOC122516969 [Polistes fuscatus]
MSKCEFCNQQLQTLRAQPALTNNSSSQCIPCSTVIQLLRGGSINHPCDSNCNCKTEVLQIEEQKSSEQPWHKKNDRSHPQKQKINHKEQSTTENQIQRDRIKDDANQALTSEKHL